MSAAFDRAEGERIANVVVIAFALGLAWGLKDFYARARFEDLTWVLAPTRRLVEWWSEGAFEVEPGRGYLSRDLLFEIVPACAGVNFMIVAFASLVGGLAHTCRSWTRRLALLIGSAFAAYGVTVIANAARITAAMRLHGAGVALGWLTPERLHCAVGVAIYFLFLSALFGFAARLTGARRDFAL